MLGDNEIVEAWQGCNKVRVIKSLGEGHKKGTPVDIYELACSPEEEAAIKFILRSKVGSKYDYLGLFAFYLNKSAANRKDRWFCSELAAYALNAILGMYHGYEAWQVSPTMIQHDNRLTLVKSVVTE